MGLASVTSNEHGATDRLLARVVARLTDDGVRVAGALRPIKHGDREVHCDSDLQLLPDGPAVRIAQDLGSGSAACRMDAGALEEAVGIALARLAEDGADLIVLNKFGLSETQGRGFRALIVDALGRDVPVLVGLTDAHQSAFERFADGTAMSLPPDEDAIFAWCKTAIRSSPALGEEA